MAVVGYSNKKEGKTMTWMEVVWLIIGLVAGSLVGILAMACCVAAGQADRARERPGRIGGIGGAGW